MKKEEVTKWLTIMKANLNSFPEVSNAKKIEALGEAIRLLKNEESKEPRTPIRPKGHWIYDKSIANWRCSKCGETPKTIAYVGTGSFMAEHFKYCNHCGAEMEGSEEE